MARVYATAVQYTEFTGQTAPTDIDAVLTRASRFLDSSVFRLCRYHTDAVTGMPTDEVVLAAFAEAVCAQVWWWDETGDELGAADKWGSVKLGSASLSTSSGTSGRSGAAAGAAAGTRTVAPAALEALRTPDLTRDRFILGWVRT